MQQTTNKFSIWLMWSLASFFYAYQYVLRVLPNIMMNDILLKFNIDAALFGQFAGLYYIGYAGMHIPIGLLLDKYGPKWVLPACIGLTVIGTLPLLYAEHWIYPGLGRLLIGMGSSAAILGVFKIIRMFFTQDKFTVILGFSVTIGLSGAIYGGKPVNYLIQNWGSELVLQGVIGIGLLLALATLWIVPRQEYSEYTQGWAKQVKMVLTQPRILLTCLFAGIMVGPLEGFADVWGLEYLKTVYKLDAGFASAKPSLIFLGMCFGSPLITWLAAKTKANLGFIILSGLIMGFGFISLLSGQFPISLLDVLFITIGVCCAYQILAIFQASTYVDEHLISLTTACANMIIMIFGYFFHSAIGQLMAYYWDGQLSAKGVPIYDPQAFTIALSIIPAGLLLGAIGFIALALTEKKPLNNGQVVGAV